MQIATLADHHGVAVAIAVDVGPGKRAQASHSRKRPELLPRAVAVVAKDDRISPANAGNQIDVAVHLDIRGPHAETVSDQRFILRRRVPEFRPNTKQD